MKRILFCTMLFVVMGSTMFSQVWVPFTKSNPECYLYPIQIVPGVCAGIVY